MIFIRFLLFPFSLLYGLVIIMRNIAYDYGVLKSTTYPVPVILIGNLAIGGAGKSPMIAYLVKKLSDRYNIAVISRGYGRKTTGFVLAHKDALATEIGDEPLQLKKKYPNVTVAVCEDRVKGINELVTDHTLILMDDGYQHRAVKPGLSILLYDFNTMFNMQWLLPTGNLREPLYGSKRADIIIVTKTSKNLTQRDRLRSVLRIKPYAHQQVFFSYLKYGNLHHLYDKGVRRTLASITKKTPIFLLTGIANAGSLLNKLRMYSDVIHHHQYPDHHSYTEKNILALIRMYKNLGAVNSLIITTEKDAQRLRMPAFNHLLNNVAIYYIPVQTVMHNLDEQALDARLTRFFNEAALSNENCS